MKQLKNIYLHISIILISFFIISATTSGQETDKVKEQILQAPSAKNEQ